jgi:hypothetical protein
MSRETIAKIEYVKALYADDPLLTRRQLNEMVKKKFKTGLAFGHMADALEGGRRRPDEPPLSAEGLKRVDPARLAPVSDALFARAPAFIIVVGGPGSKAFKTLSLDSKSEVRAAIGNLVLAGAKPAHIRIYSRDSFSVETRPIVSLA